MGSKRLKHSRNAAMTAFVTSPVSEVRKQRREKPAIVAPLNLQKRNSMNISVTPVPQRSGMMQGGSSYGVG